VYSSFIIQNRDILVSANSGPPGKMAVKMEFIIELLTSVNISIVDKKELNYCQFHNIYYLLHLERKLSHFLF